MLQNFQKIVKITTPVYLFFFKDQTNNLKDVLFYLYN